MAPVLGPVPIIKPALQKDKCKRTVPCRKKRVTVPSASRAVPKTLLSVNGALTAWKNQICLEIYINNESLQIILRKNSYLRLIISLRWLMLLHF